MATNARSATPVGATPTEETPAATEVVERELEKAISSDVIASIETASDGLKGDAYKSFEDATKAVEDGGDPFFNPTLAQYRVGLIINTDRNVCKFKKVSVGTGSRKAWCITAPAGYKINGEIVYNQAFNFYPSTLRKQIQLTDENGDPVLDDTKSPITLDGKGNAVWEAARACANEKELLEYAVDKIFETYEIVRDFGPAVFVKQLDGSRKATSHRLTTLPKFNVIG